jgi:hypothetical protein
MNTNSRRRQAASPPDALTQTAGISSIRKPLDSVTDRLALRLDEIARSLGVSRRSLERVRSAGRFPPPDVHIGRMPLWRIETLRRWLEWGGR